MYKGDIGLESPQSDQENIKKITEEMMAEVKADLKKELREEGMEDEALQKMLSNEGYLLDVKRRWRSEMRRSIDKEGERRDELKKEFFEMIMDISKENQYLRLRELVKAQILEMYDLGKTEDEKRDMVRNISDAFEKGSIQLILSNKMEDFSSSKMDKGGEAEAGYVKDVANQIKGDVDRALTKMESLKENE